ncbi:uncharacterized protein METZ01_LOCUS343502, partial [marine metagenome]
MHLVFEGCRNCFSHHIGRLSLAAIYFASWSSGASEIKEKARDHWAFQPISENIPPKAEGAGVAIDSFVQVKLRENGLRFSPKASNATLIRRLSF